VEVYTTSPVVAHDISSKGGTHGVRGAGGNGGKKGIGGEGGRKIYCQMNDAPDGGDYCAFCENTNERHPRGNDGNDGIGRVGQDGLDGVTYIPIVKQINKDEFGKLFSNELLNYFEIQVENGDLSYKTNDLKAAYGIYKELIIKNTLPDGSKVSQKLDQYLVTQVGKMNAGLDYFGYHPTFVPILDRSIYEQQNERTLKLLSNAEAAIENLKTQDLLLSVRREISNSVGNVIGLKIIDFDNALDIQMEEKSRLQMVNRDLISKRDLLYEELKALWQNRERAIRLPDESNFDFLTFAANVVKIVTVGPQAIQGIVDLGVVDFVKSKDGIGQVKEVASSIGGIITITSTNDLKKQTELLNIDKESKRLLTAVIDLSDKINTNAWQLKSIAAREQSINNFKLGLGRLKTNIADALLQTDLESAQKLRSIEQLEDLRISAVELMHLSLYLYSKSIYFWRLKQPELDYSVLTSSLNIAQSLNVFKQSELNYYEGIARRFDNELIIDFSINDHPDLFRDIKDKESSIINISQSNFLGFQKNIRCQDIHFDVRFWGAKTTNGKLIVSVKHSGVSYITSREGIDYSFDHVSKRIPKQYLISDWSSLFNPVYEISYAEISPITSWVISVPKKDNLGLDLSNCNKISLLIKYSFEDEL
jgi:hypothetical protein